MGDLMADDQARTRSSSSRTITLPGIGPVKTQHALIGAAVVAGVVGYAWWSRAAAGPVPDVPAYTEEDVQADGVGDAPGGPAGAPANSGGGTTDGSTLPDTDAEWVRQAVELVSGGYDVGSVQTALGRYITRQSLTTSQEDIVRAAIGAVGYPPGGAYPITSGGAGPAPSALVEPRGLTAPSTTATSVTLTWSPVPGAAGYRVYRSGAATNTGHTVDTRITVGGLTPGTSYTWHVRAMTAAGKTGPRSADLKAATAGAALKAPTGLTSSTTTKTTVSLAWKPVPGATGYRVYRKGVSTNIGASADTKITLGGLKANTAYTHYVAAVAGSTVGPKSTGRAAKTRK